MTSERWYCDRCLRRYHYKTGKCPCGGTLTDVVVETLTLYGEPQGVQIGDHNQQTNTYGGAGYAVSECTSTPDTTSSDTSSNTSSASSGVSDGGGGGGGGE